MNNAVVTVLYASLKISTLQRELRLSKSVDLSSDYDKWNNLFKRNLYRSFSTHTFAPT